MTTTSRDPSSSPEDNVWSSILSETRTSIGSKVMKPGKTIVIFGDNESGKTTLVAKLQGIEEPKKGSGLEYAHLEVRDEYRDESTQLNVWVLDGTPQHSHLLKFALPSTTPFETIAKDTLIIITVSMATPWNILEQLQFWAGILHDHLDSLNIPMETFKEVREENLKRWRNYKEFNDGHGDGEFNKDEEKEMGNVLQRNLGLDLVVVVTKTDHVASFERESYREEHFDFIQFHLRKFCLLYGAGLCYTSVKEDKNCDLLYKYIVHRLYYSSMDFKTPGLVVEKDAVFIPSGWDNEKKMSILSESMSTFKPEDFYNSVIEKPSRNKGKNQTGENPPTETFTTVVQEDEQKFLKRLINQGNFNSSPKTSAKNSPNPALNENFKSPQQPTSAHKKELGTPQNSASPASSERVLAHFFNSLLSKKGRQSGEKQGDSEDLNKSSDC